MMNKKLIVTLSVIIIYVIIIALFIKFFTADHSYGTRFCSTDTETFSNQFLMTEFKKSNSSKLFNDEHYDYVKKLTIYRGQPLCGGLIYISLDTVVNDQYYQHNTRGLININHQSYDHERYCLDKADDIPDGWKLMICHNDVLLHKIFHFTVIILSILLFGSTIFVYAYYKELRDFKGKAVIGLMLSEILAYSAHSIKFQSNYEFNPILVSATLMGLLQILLWITVMVVHEFIAFKNFKKAAPSEQKFGIYVIIEIIFTISFIILNIYTHIYRHRTEAVEYYFIALFFIGAFDIIVLIITGIRILILSRHMTHSDQARFDDETKWYWIIVKLCLIMLIAWPFQVLSWLVEFSLYGFITKDFILLFTAITATIILLGRRKVRNSVFGKYHGINNVEA